MTPLLEKAIQETSVLPESEQDFVAQFMLDTIQNEWHRGRQPVELAELRSDLDHLAEVAGTQSAIEIDDRAASMITPKIQIVLNKVVLLMLEYAKSRNIDLVSTEIDGCLDAGDGSGDITISQRINMGEDEAMKYWDDVCDAIQTFEESSLSPEEARIARRISTAIRPPSLASPI